MDNLDDILKGNDEPEAVAETTPEPETPQAEPEKAERPRGPDGKFIPKGETEPEAPVAAPPAAEEPASTIPESALIGERRRRQEAEDRLRELERKLQVQQPQPQPEVPDVFADPEGFYGHIQQTIVQATLNDRLNLSEEMVRQSAGDETVNAAQEWGREQIASNPMFAQQFYSQRNPYGYLVSEYQRHTSLQKLGNDPKAIDDYLAWKAAQAAAPPPAPPVPETLANAQSARGSVQAYEPPSLEEILRK
jgi:hypothetical protein